LGKVHMTTPARGLRSHAPGPQGRDGEDGYLNLTFHNLGVPTQASQSKVRFVGCLDPRAHRLDADAHGWERGTPARGEQQLPRFMGRDAHDPSIFA
jgi:hypothetical protein